MDENNNQVNGENTEDGLLTKPKELIGENPIFSFMQQKHCSFCSLLFQLYFSTSLLSFRYGLSLL